MTELKTLKELRYWLQKNGTQSFGGYIEIKDLREAANEWRGQLKLFSFSDDSQISGRYYYLFL